MSHLLIEQVVSAFRERVHGQLRSAPAWHDLTVDERDEAFAETVASRALESALDAQGLSTTGHAVLAQILAG